MTVFPKPIPCEIHLHVSDHNIAKKDGQLISEQSGHDDFSHLKAYQPGEPLNHVAWKQLAKGRGMVSKQFTSVGHHIGWLKLSSEYKNQIPSQPKAELGKSDKTNLDKELGELCYQVIELSRTQRTFGLDLGVQCISPNSGAEHRHTYLHALAYFPNGEQ
jgi:uncharacterized protein (DUF58 family)